MTDVPIRPVRGSGRALSVDDTGIAFELPTDAAGDPYRRYVYWLDAGSNNVHFTAGDSTLVAGDVDTFDESATQADPILLAVTDDLQAIDVYGNTHLALRCATGETATGFLYADDQFRQGQP